MKKKIIRILSIVLPLLLGVFLIIYTYNRFTPQQLEDLNQAFKKADYKYIYLSLIIAFTGYVSRAYRWKYTLQHMGYTSPFYNNFFAVSIAYFMNLTIPRSGEVARAVTLKRYSNVPFDKALGTIISERVIDLFILIFCIAGTVALQFTTLKDYLLEQIPFEKLLMYGVISGIMFIGAVLMFMYSRMKWIQKLKIKISGLKEGVLSVFKMPNKWPFLLHSVYIWVTYVLMFYISIFALPETAQLGFGTVAAAFVIGSLAITFSNGGFAVYPFVIAKILSLYAVPEATGTAFGWIVWTSQIILILFLGIFSFLLLPILNRKK
ncbi:lysylphosphatidylglycerol synthase transmembrane domain-containing protein [Flavobacterium rhizosphaerae]|uniref:Lysylphosphatidylglycerol synthase transmembrane domain-containing protein n=1 Tax=Flavobacterium rhizosphaerae TaxID=3163298 RepID=A0ABW8YYR4_9FLAO